MQQIKNIFDHLQATSSRKEKEEILFANKDNEDFKTTLYFLLNTYITTGISTNKINKVLSIATQQSYNLNATSFKDLMKYIQDNNTGRDIDIWVCQQYINQFENKEMQDFIKSIITKSFKLGLDVKSVNKVYGENFIPTWEVQLGSSFEKLKLKDNELFFISQKLNGNRSSYVDGTITSRQGNEFTGLQHIIDNIIECGLENYFVDGELVRKNIDNISDGENFRIGTGIINSESADKSQIKLVIFDMFPTSELVQKESIDIYKVRKEKLLALSEVIKSKKLEHIEIVNMLYEGTDKTKIDELLELAVQNDWEGVMLNKNTTYKCKRTTDLIKVKRFYTVDLEVVALEEGTGRLQGTLGALVVKFKNNTVNVGSGYDDTTRNDIWKNRDNIIGSIIEVKYKEITSDKKTGLESLQFPIFIRLRNDKTQASYN